MQEQFEISGQFLTPNGQKYLVQLCKHFGHKVPVEQVGDDGTIRFAMGEAHLTATETALLAKLVGATEEAAVQLGQIIDDHLKRFAFREDFSGMTWSRPTVD